MRLPAAKLPAHNNGSGPLDDVLWSLIDIPHSALPLKSMKSTKLMQTAKTFIASTCSIPTFYRTCCRCHSRQPGPARLFLERTFLHHCPKHTENQLGNSRGVLLGGKLPALESVNRPRYPGQCSNLSLNQAGPPWGQPRPAIPTLALTKPFPNLALTCPRIFQQRALPEGGPLTAPWTEDTPN